MNVQLVVRVPEEQKLMLEVIASNKQVSVGKITREAIKNYVAIETKSQKNLFARLAKIGRSKKVIQAPKDLSVNYKKYLYTS